jgi:thymidylate synthase
MSIHDNEYHNLITHVLQKGNLVQDRTGTGTVSTFGTRMEFNLQKGFPLLTTKFVSFKTLANELLWFLSGSTNNNDLRKLNGNNKPTIWEEWADENGELGEIYPKQWRNYGGNENKKGIDQIQNVINSLKFNPHSRRHIVDAWNVEDVEEGKMALPPCHALFQFYVEELPPSLRDVTGKQYYLSCQLYQRSCDVFLGVPYNIASYSLLTHMIANLLGMLPYKFIWIGGDTHIYTNHMQQITLQLSNDENRYKAPQLVINNKHDSINDYVLNDLELIGYNHYPAIYAPVSV